MSGNLDYIYVGGEEPHRKRGQEILKKYPQIGKLCGPTPSTAFFVVLLFSLQMGLAYLVSGYSWWVGLILAYLVGAAICHAMWVLIHDCTHNLVFTKPTANKVLQIFANFVHVLPSAMAFRKFHMHHHRYQGQRQLDADLAQPFEAKFAGNSSWRKALWLLFFVLFQSVRASRLKKISFIDGWILVNYAAVFAFDALVIWLLGPSAILYMLFSSLFAVGLHPLGARWIQEHFVVHPGQETFSYYGPLNKIAFNVGYHNEHHDFMRVPWSRLPQVKKIAPEFYDTLYFHTSWTRLLIRFLFDPKITLYSRAVR